MERKSVIHIMQAVIRNFKNVESGEIRFPLGPGRDIYVPTANILGIYGQNGSGKTAFLEALEILKKLLSGQEIKEELSCISYGKERTELEFEFSILELDGAKELCRRRFVYSASIGKDAIDETVKCVTFDGNADKHDQMRIIFEVTHQPNNRIFTPYTKLKSLFGTKRSTELDELRVIKLLCQKECRSFLFSPEFMKTLCDMMPDHDDGIESLFEISHFAKTSLFIILNRNDNLIALDPEFAANSGIENNDGLLFLPMNQPTTVPNYFLSTIRKEISVISSVLSKVVPGANLEVAEIGTELMRDGSLGSTVQLVRRVSGADGKTFLMPLRYESEGIKKMVSVLHLLITVYNDPSITIAIDELDSGIFEYLLGELLRIIQNSGKGQLIFTAHDLHPLETLKSGSIIFTTSNAKDRYTRMTRRVGKTSNVRAIYLREATLRNDDTVLCEEISMPEIANTMRAAGKNTESE